MQVAFDMLRGFLAFVLIFAAIVAIIYFVVPGVGDFSPDRAVQRIARARMATSMFGGAGLVLMAVFLTIGIMSAIYR